MVRGRGNTDNVILHTMRHIAAILDAIEIVQRRGSHLDDVSDDEALAPNLNLKT